MNKRKAVIILLVTVLLVSAFAASKNVLSSRVNLISPSHRTSPLQDHSVPDHVVYGFLFRKVEFLNKRAKKLQSEGRIKGADTLPLQQEANLTQKQIRILNEIASACEQEVKQQDGKARTVIEAFRAQFPDRIVPKGVTPLPPPELKTMWEERNAMILRARDRLRIALGEQEFYRLDQYAKFRFGADEKYKKHRLENTIPAPQRP
ncbi:MAG: hypothetical protein ACR2G4_10625 [Pyrinomonadaceae bacterium]